jgi:hypothetical protein
MKNTKRALMLLLTMSLIGFFNFSNAQTMQVASGSFGILNPKLRLQYERGLGEKASVGLVMHYYMVNWTGPKFEVFGRLYGKKNGNKEGFFLQGKVGYGNLKSLLYEDYFALDSYYQSFYGEPKKRWSTIGAGAGTGYKFAVTDHFVIESILGVHFYSPPNADYEYTAAYNSADPYEQAAADAAALGEDIGWYLTTGLPLDFQIKFGYAF